MEAKVKPELCWLVVRCPGVDESEGQLVRMQLPLVGRPLTL